MTRMGRAAPPLQCYGYDYGGPVSRGYGPDCAPGQI